MDIFLQRDVIPIVNEYLPNKLDQITCHKCGTLGSVTQTDEEGDNITCEFGIELVCNKCSVQYITCTKCSHYNEDEKFEIPKIEHVQLCQFLGCQYTEEELESDDEDIDDYDNIFDEEYKECVEEKKEGFPKRKIINGYTIVGPLWIANYQELKNVYNVNRYGKFDESVDYILTGPDGGYRHHWRCNKCYSLYTYTDK